MAKASTRKARNSSSASPNNTFAIVAVAEETPENPRMPETTEMARKMRAHFSMTCSAWLDCGEDNAGGGGGFRREEVERRPSALTKPKAVDYRFKRVSSKITNL